MVKITLDGVLSDVEDGIRLRDLAPPDALAAVVNGQPVDLATVIEEYADIHWLTFADEVGREIFWHSTSHLLAHAVKRLFPRAKLGIGPAIDDGFYYDFDVDKPFTDKDLKAIEKEMRRLASRGLPIRRRIFTKGKLEYYYRFWGEDLKLEIIEEIEDAEISVYEQDDFLDVCRGPHLDDTSKIGSFKLLSVAGAYWRGDESRRMLQRIYGISFPTAEELKDYLKRLEQAKASDHRILNRKLDLFDTYEEVGPGLILWKPKGTILRKVITDFWTAEHLKRGYQIVTSPHIARAELWKISGHYDYYKENMYLTSIEDKEYAIKPMNCPAHMMLYRSRKHSYRELPIRYAELGTVYRNERSGVVQGLLRVRGFTIDDAHIFCTPEQAPSEVADVLDLCLFTIDAFGYSDIKVELSLWDPDKGDKYAGTPEKWEHAQEVLEQVLVEKKTPYKRIPGEAAFYGPKIDIKLLDALGRSWQASTIQFDFNLPERFGLFYVGEDGSEHEVRVIHRAVLGSLERFIGGLIEHYKGDFPLWLAPYQVAVLTVTDAAADYGAEVAADLIDSGLRVVTDFSADKIGAKIRKHENQKVPYMIILGTKEAGQGTLTLRRHRKGDLGSFTLAEALRRFKQEIKQRR
ncbi:threonine--tRNA ligase [candidate division WOR-3 bacterium]|uniref:Threonine--tRNA ligase n=1 Tax=candidate division WOR-3 bacterium TaxID=2052148 RepID=A0A9D5KA39_UNCW3|nr:threonine--tRNA ligase [candidate division WOR-3 bacterium]MBD3365283.1 threonine--tRNA ligase [candidate division WOR-3 bacterium]